MQMAFFCFLFFLLDNQTPKLQNASLHLLEPVLIVVLLQALKIKSLFSQKQNKKSQYREQPFSHSFSL
jgi:branched-subunit amino acid permease